MRSILVIDDEPVLLDIIETALTESGHRVEIAEDGKDGIKKFEKGTFDIVITDLVMPNGNGNSVVHHIRKSERSWTPIIAISGTPWLIDKNGVDRILTKPFPLKILFDAIENLYPSTRSDGDVRRIREDAN
jgi:DNA-binding response OmpR family regulator